MKFKKIFVHVGTGKTGTSYLQSCFEQLELSGAFKNTTYPVTMTGEDFQKIRSGNALDLAMSLAMTDPADFCKSRMEAELDALLNKANKEKNNLLLSCEYLFSVDKVLLAELLNTLGQYSPNIEVIVVTRPIRELAYSSYNQSIKRHAATHQYDDEFLDQFCVAIAETLKNFDFVRQRVHVLSYKKHDLLENFLSLLDEPIEIGMQFKNIVVNRSLDATELKILARINKIFSDEHLASAISDRWIYESHPLAADETKNNRAVEIFAKYAKTLKLSSSHAQQMVDILSTSSESVNTPHNCSYEQPVDLEQKFIIALEEIGRHCSQFMFLKNYVLSLPLSKEHFDPVHYLLINQDVLREGMDPILHYETFGCNEGRYTSFV
jgi:hypothetical protein